jgi:FAD/FMN-containing dehydrogenase
MTSTPDSLSPQHPAATKRRRRWPVLVVVVIAGALLLWRPAWHLWFASWRDVNELEPTPLGFADDVSRLNQTPVAEVVPVESDAVAAERQLAALLRRARDSGLTVSLAGARHSMGGHTISPQGIVIDMLPFHDMRYDAEREILHVQAGARWSQIIPYLDPFQRSVGVMQSDNTFTVGGSLSVNCHGWQFGRPPIASTVESLRVMRADGQVVRCSRGENPELFSLVLGGYGLFGIILDVELRVVPNERYRLEQYVVPVAAALETFDAKVRKNPEAVMVYARLGIVPDRFLEEVIINVLVRDPPADGHLPELSEPGLVRIRRSLFRGSVGSDYGKELRWQAEARLQPHLTTRHFSRNQLLNEGSETYQNRSAATTDILHEYFVPLPQVQDFVSQLRNCIPRHNVDLLNITVREVETDVDTFLRYADRPLIAFVMLFNQPRTVEGERQMQNLTSELIDVALAHDGRYYLPYRLHASPRQIRRAYPQIDQFFSLKRKYDPEELFQNQFYRTYQNTGPERQVTP